MKLHGLGIALLVVLVLSTGPLASAGTANFDGVSAPCFYLFTPGYSPTVYPEVTFSNGVIQNDCGWDAQSTTHPNLYATSDYAPLADGSMLPGNIDAHFATPVFNVQFDVINGFGASTFTGLAYDGSGNLLGSAALSLNTFPLSGDTGRLFLSFSNISEVVVLSSQSTGSIDFATDTWSWNGSSPTPEPCTLVLLGSGLVGAWSQRKRFSR